MKGMNVFKIGMIVLFFSLIGCSFVSQEPSKIKVSSKTKKPTNLSLSKTHSTNKKIPTNSTSAYSNTSLWEGDNKLIWDKLQRTSSTKLTLMQQKNSDPIQLAWIQLAKLSKQKMISTQQFASELIVWQKQNPNHPANQLLPNNLTQLQAEKMPKRIALLLPQSGPYGVSGQNLREGFLNAYFSHLNNAEIENIKFYDTTQSKNITSLYQKAITDGADIVIGPLLKGNVHQLSRMSSFPIPILALNYTDATPEKLPNNFYEFGLLPEDEALQSVMHARAAGLLHAIVIAPENAWGKRLVSAFAINWKAKGGSIVDTWSYSSRNNFNQEVARLLNIHFNPNKLTQHPKEKSVLNPRRQDFDVIFLFSKPQDARVIVPLIHYYYAGKIPIYAASSVYSESNVKNDMDLNGVIVCDIPENLKFKHTDRNNHTFNRLYAVGQDAYLLSQSLSRLTHLSHFPIYARTGALMLSSQHQIHRRLPCMTIQHGRLK